MDAPAVETHPLSTDFVLPPKPVPKNKEPVFIRRATILDGMRIGQVAAETYLNAPFSQFRAPHRFKYPKHWERGFVQRATKRLLKPRGLTFVACLESDPNKLIACAQFVRLGDDGGAQAQIESFSLLKRILMAVLLMLYSLWCTLVDWVAGGDKSADPKAVKQFGEWVSEDEENHWDSHPERRNRWHAQSVTVREEFQGRGIGKLLMAEVMKRAEEDNVVVGLESSVKGEMLYRKVGFELLARFREASQTIEGIGGGFMMVSRLNL